MEKLDRYPDWRFQQILQNVDISTRDGKDLFYEESVDTMKKNPIIRASDQFNKI